MSLDSANSQKRDEIDFSHLSRKIGETYQSFLSTIFSALQFVIRNIISIIVLGLLGLVIGYFLDKGSKSYGHEIYVKPNFGSTNLLYSQIDLLQSKIKEKDTIFFKSIGVLKPKSLGFIEIEPLVDIYGLVNERTLSVSNSQNSQNFELLKLLSESSDINKVIKGDLTGRNYGTHLIHIITHENITREGTIDPILNFLNNEEFFLALQKQYLIDLQIKINSSEEIIEQIDVILDNFGAKTNPADKNDKLIYYNENTQLNDVINTKKELISELGNDRLDLIKYSKVIKEKSSVLNVKKTQSIFTKMKFILPVILILGFIFLVIIRSFYKTQLVKFKERT